MRGIYSELNARVGVDFNYTESDGYCWANGESAYINGEYYYDYNGWYSEWDSKYRDLVSKHDMNFHLGTEYGEFLEWKANTPQEDLDEIYGLTEAKRLADEMGGALGSDPQ